MSAIDGATVNQSSKTIDDRLLHEVELVSKAHVDVLDEHHTVALGEKRSQMILDVPDSSMSAEEVVEPVKSNRDARL